jgi:hypothetical protein
MNNWREVIEEGQIFYINEKLGNIQKLCDGVYIAFFPKIIKLGPFSSLESAKQALESCETLFDDTIETLNQKVSK